MPKLILCIPTDVARAVFPEVGLNVGRSEALFRAIGDHGAWKPKTDELEADPQWRQVCTYGLVSLSIQGHHYRPPWILTYRRRAKPDQPSLSGARSLGVGGHVELSDEDGSTTPGGILMRAWRREMAEEIGSARIMGPNHEPIDLSVTDTQPKAVGVIRTESEAGLHHVGFVTLAKLDWKAAGQPGVCGELLDAKFVRPHDLHQADDLEPWSRVLLDWVRPPAQRESDIAAEAAFASQQLLSKYQGV